MHKKGENRSVFRKESDIERNRISVNLDEYYEKQGRNESIYTTYESKLGGRRFFFQERSKMILSLLNFKNDSKFLDIGTGVGHYIHDASIRNSQGRNISIDISLTYLRQVQKRLNKVVNSATNSLLIRADARRLPSNNKIFDIVLCTEVIEHIPHYGKVIKEISRVTKPGARIIITFPSRWSPDELLGQIKGYLSFYEHINVIAFNTFKQLCKQNNLNILNVYHCCFCFQAFSRLLNIFPFLTSTIRFVERSIRKIPILCNLCWSTIIMIEKDR